MLREPFLAHRGKLVAGMRFRVVVSSLLERAGLVGAADHW